MPKTIIEPPKLTAEQIGTIIDRLVPQIAAPEDHAFFRGVLWINAESMGSARFALFVKRLLDNAGAAPVTIDTASPTT